MSRKSSTDAPETPSPPPPVREGQRLCSGRLSSLPITAGDQGDPTGGDDTASSPPASGMMPDLCWLCRRAAHARRPLIWRWWMRGPPSSRKIVLQAVRTPPRRKRMTPHPFWIFRRCRNRLQPLLQRVTWLLHRLPTKYRLLWQR
jgi:hypothetical protein